MKATVTPIPRNPYVGLNTWDCERAARDAGAIHRLLRCEIRTFCHHCRATFTGPDTEADAAWHVARTRHTVITTSTTVDAWASIDDIDALIGGANEVGGAS